MFPLSLQICAGGKSEDNVRNVLDCINVYDRQRGEVCVSIERGSVRLSVCMSPVLFEANEEPLMHVLGIVLV